MSGAPFIASLFHAMSGYRRGSERPPFALAFSLFVILSVHSESKDPDEARAPTTAHPFLPQTSALACSCLSF